MNAVKAIVIAFSVFHALAITADGFPSDTALGSSLSDPFQSYIWSTGNFQDWNMFHSVPNTHALEIEIVAVDESGQSLRLNPLLPGFAPYTQRLRISPYFVREINGDHRLDYFESYAQKLCAAIRSEKGFQAQTVSIRLLEQRIRYLARIREDRKIHYPVTVERGPYRCSS